MQGLLATNLEEKEANEVVELGQMKKRVERLCALVFCFAQQLDATDSSVEPDDHRIYDYSILVQEYVDAILMYQKIARYWSICNKQCVKELIDKAITSHGYLTGVLEKQSELLARKIEKIDLPRKVWVYHNNQGTGQAFDFKG